MMWRDTDFIVKSDCPLCAGIGFYEVIFIHAVTSDRRRYKSVVGFRIYGTGLNDMKGYRVLTRCHLCDAAYHRGVPNDIGCWKDNQIDNLLSLQEWNGDPEF